MGEIRLKRRAHNTTYIENISVCVSFLFITHTDVAIKTFMYVLQHMYKNEKSFRIKFKK